MSEGEFRGQFARYPYSNLMLSTIESNQFLSLADNAALLSRVRQILKSLQVALRQSRESPINHSAAKLADQALEPERL